jgi:anti-sigma factor RsiW
MDYSDDNMIRYLFGELSETERTEIERQYFTDAAVLGRLVQIEEDLIDDYARDRLAPELRQRFERAFLSQPGRQMRVQFGRALIARVDQTGAAMLSATPETSRSWWQRLGLSLGNRRPVLAFSMAMVLLLLVIGSIWLFIRSRRQSEGSAPEQAAQSSQQRQNQSESPPAAEQNQNQELTVENQPPVNTNAPHPAPSASAAPVFVSLALLGSSARSGDTGAKTLTIPKGTEQVHLSLEIEGNDYERYQVSLRMVGGGEIYRSDSPRPRITKSGATFNFSLATSKFISGDYLLSLKGAPKGADFEDVSKSLFRVEKK